MLWAKHFTSSEGSRVAIRKWGLIFLFLYSILALLAHFFFIGLAPFLQDEPKFQLVLDSYLASKTMPLLSLVGMKGISYGPTVQWFYWPLRLFTADVSALIYYHLFFFLFSILVLVACTAREYGLEAAAWLLALLASSPYLFFYSRMAWDVSLFVALMAPVFLCLSCLNGKDGILLWAILGLSCGLLFNLHLMSVPILAAVAVVCVPYLIQSQNRIRKFLLAIVIFLICVFKYLQEISPALKAGNFFHFSFQNCFHAILTMSKYFSCTGMEYFFDGASLYRLPWDFSIPIQIVAWLSVAHFFWLGGKKIAQFGAFSLFFVVIYYSGIAPDLNHPHYGLSVWWVLFFFAAIGIAKTTAWLHGVLVLLGLIVIFTNTAFLFVAQKNILQNQGFRSIHYGPAQKETERVVREICEAAKTGVISIDLKSVRGLFLPAIEFYTKHLQSCQNLKLDLLGAEKNYRLFYKNKYPSAALSWELSSWIYQ